MKQLPCTHLPRYTPPSSAVHLSPYSDGVVLNPSVLGMKNCQYCSTAYLQGSLKFKYVANILDFDADFLTKYFLLLFYSPKSFDIITQFSSLFAKLGSFGAQAT